MGGIVDRNVARVSGWQREYQKAQDELDDGYTRGSVHPGCTVVPAVLSAGYVKKASGTQLIEATVSVTFAFG